MTEQHRQWLQERREKEYFWMNDDQFECWCMLCELLHGGNHQFGKIKPAGPDGITVEEHAAGGWGTYDFDDLTRAVVLAHDRCIRFYVSPCNSQKLRFHLQKRDTRDGNTMVKHPTMEEAIEKIRKAS